MYGWSGYRYRERPATNLIDPFKNSFFRPTCTTFLNISSVNRDTFPIQISPIYPRFGTNTGFRFISYEPPLRLKKLFTIIFRYKLVPLYKVSKHTFQQFKSNHTRYVKSRKIIQISFSIFPLSFNINPPCFPQNTFSTSVRNENRKSREIAGLFHCIVVKLKKKRPSFLSKGFVDRSLIVLLVRR